MRATVVTLDTHMVVMAGEPILDKQEGTLTLLFEDLTSRIFNWDKVVDYYYMTEEETADWLAERENN
ncbi:hypothetical protein 40AC_49 [Mycobacterium phage 40AC]|uniref:Uncharacterized protein n=1 Tax=Mycobacterium phage 40AC TaxID=1458717 RepID=W8ECK5_9CAUD|nr:hypothetical protein ST40AC_49 [Mycobacterium phage 40AC]AHJ86412.1 hypothetical protein 40AC_49 [Mycobacterium phage 40AC]